VPLRGREGEVTALARLHERGLLVPVEVLSVEVESDGSARVRFMDEDGRGGWHGIDVPPGTAPGYYSLRPMRAWGVRVHYGLVLAREEHDRVARALGRGEDPNDAGPGATHA
jgi:hypothetical protein